MIDVKASIEDEGSAGEDVFNAERRVRVQLMLGSERERTN